MPKLKSRFYVVQLDFAGADALDAASATSASDLFTALRVSLLELFGDAGWGAVASVLAVKFFSPATRLAVVRGPAASDAHVRAALALVKTVRKRSAALHVLSVSSRVDALRASLAHWGGVVALQLRAAGGGGGAGTAALSDEFFVALEAECNDALL